MNPFRKLAPLYPFLTIAALVIALWLPFGLQTTGLMEEWLIRNEYENPNPSQRGEEFDMITLTGAQRMRPFVGTSFVLAHLIAPDSWVGFNLWMIGAFIAKGAALYLILRRLKLSTAFALSAALLFIIYPADAGLFTMRAMNIHTAVAAYLASVYGLLVFHERRNVWVLLLTWVGLAFALLTYEIVYPLVMFTPTLLLWNDGKYSRRVLRSALAWYVVPALTLIYSALIFVSGMTYQSWVLQRSGLTQPDIVAQMVNSVILMLQRHFIDGWMSAVVLSLFGFVYFAIFIICLILLWATKSLSKRVTEGKSFRSLVLVGIAVLFLGWILYLPTPFRDVEWRSYYYSSIGGAILITALVDRLARRYFFAFMSFLLVIAFAWALEQHEQYDQYSNLQISLLRGIVHHVPRIESGGTLVVVDETGQYWDNWTLGTSDLVEYALQFLYRDYDLNAILCSYDPDTQTFRTLPELREQCVFTPESITLLQDNTPYAIYSSSDVVVIRSMPNVYVATEVDIVMTLADYGVAAPDYDLMRWIDTNAPLPPRAVIMFGLE